MLSRVADSIYWLNRYIERSENYARIIKVNYLLSLDLPGNVDLQWMPLVATTGDLELFSDQHDSYGQDQVIRFLTFSKENPNSILSCLKAARFNARGIRDNISRDMWEALNEFYYLVKESVSLEPSKYADFFQELIRKSHLFHGTMDDTINRDESYFFGILGRFIERADKTSRFLDLRSFHGDAKDTDANLEMLHWFSVLKSMSAFEMYSRSSRIFSKESICEFLILYPHFPRSIHFCIRQINWAMRVMSGSSLDIFHDDAERENGKLLAELRFKNISEILHVGLHQYLDQLQNQFNVIGSLVEKRYLQNSNAGNEEASMQNCD